MRFSFRLNVVLAVFTSGSLAHAVLVQPSLPPGTQYRLAFLTSTSRNASSTNIADYNTFVTGRANTQPDLVALGTTWTAIGSTSSISARTNTNTDPTPAGDTGVPIYRVDGVKIADHYDDLWDGSLDAALSITEFGTFPSPTPFTAWTGTTSAGLQHGIRDLGDSSAEVGTPISASTTWIDNGNSTSSASQFPMYAISGILTAVPEPNAFLCIGVVAVLAFGARVECATSLAQPFAAPRFATSRGYSRHSVFGGTRPTPLVQPR